MRRGQTGFTLLELVVTIGVLGIFASIASLAAAPFISRMALSRGATQVASDLRLLRFKAITHNRPFRVVFPDDGSAYTVAKDVIGTGWTPHVLYGWVETSGAAVPVALPTQVRSAAATVVFGPRGTLPAPISVTLSAAGAGSRTVSVSLAGAVSVN